MRKPPEHLSDESKRLYRDILEEFDPAELEHELLVAALDARDLMVATRERLAEDGIIAPGSRGQPSSHPAVLIARDARTQFATSSGNYDSTGTPMRRRDDPAHTPSQEMELRIGPRWRKRVPLRPPPLQGRSVPPPRRRLTGTKSAVSRENVERERRDSNPRPPA